MENLWITLALVLSVAILTCTGSNSPLSYAELQRCKSPSGTDCNWYADCLNRHFSGCYGTDNYATNYGRVYCKKYEGSFRSFSALGQTWIRSVKKCLMKAIAPQLSVSPRPSCSQLKTKAFRTHVGCYTNPPNGPSICDLSVNDWVQIVKTVKSSFASEFSNTVGQTFNVAAICPVQWANKATDWAKNAINAVIG